jgi:methylenetetrahydrofolate--tRNA-(uracil-5-)-methyltransferase
MLGALSRYISDDSVVNFQPMGANMGLLPPLENAPRLKKQDKYEKLAERALEDLRRIADENRSRRIRR